MIWICIIAFVGLGQQMCTHPKKSKSNGVFEMISFDNDKLQFRAVEKTKLSAVALIANDQAFGYNDSLKVDGMHWMHGITIMGNGFIRTQSTVNMPEITLSKDAVITIFGFKTPENIKPSKIRFTTEGATEMYFNILTSSWDK